MNFYQRINKTILERFPTMWNTQFVWMILICLITHVLYFGLGYASLNIERLKDYGVRSLFVNGSYFSFYFIIGLLALIFFGFRYFAHNPFKHFYPLSKAYFWKILGQLFVIFFLYGSVFISFENGMKLKAKKIVPIDVVQKEADQIALATPFMYNEIGDYYIKNRSYPEPFPCEDIENFIIKHDSINDIDIRHNIDYAKPYVTINGNSFQFGKLSTKRIDSCKTKEVLDTIYDVSKVYGLAQYSFYNYSGSELRGNRKYIDESNFVEDEVDLQLEKIHSWHKNKDSVSITKTIQSVKDICKKYQINEMLNPMKMASGGLKQDLNVQQLVRTGFVDYKDNISDSAKDAVEDAVGVVTSSEDGGNINKAQIEFNYFADLPEFTTIKENVETLQDEMGTKQLYTNAFWVLFFGSIIAAMFLLLVKYIPVKDLIIGIFVALVLVALLALYVATTERFEDGNSETRVLRVCLFYAALIMGVGFYGFYSNGIKKALLTKWFVGFGAATLAFFPALLFYIQQKLYKEVLVDCQTYTSKIYNFEVAPWQFLVLGLLSIFIIFTMLRKLYAKVE
jgi:hypothetical protein